MQSTEQWKPVFGYEGYYEVSDLGRVRSVGRMVDGPTGAKQHLHEGRVLRPGLHRQGYFLVSLHGPLGKRTHKVHRLVAIAFLGERADQEVCHNNSDPADNRVTNLRWDTRSGNMLDAVTLGRNPSTRKTHCPRGHLLQMPNLRPHEWRVAGKRICYSCARANDRSRRSGQPFSDEWANEVYRIRMGAT